MKGFIDRASEQSKPQSNETPFLLHQSEILYLHTSVLLIISLHLSAILNHTLSSQLSLPSHPAPAPPIRSLRYWRSINLVVCTYSSRTLHYIALALQSSAIVIVCRLSVCRLSVTRVYCDKTTEIRITQLSLNSKKRRRVLYFGSGAK